MCIIKRKGRSGVAARAPFYLRFALSPSSDATRPLLFPHKTLRQGNGGYATEQRAPPQTCSQPYLYCAGCLNSRWTKTIPEWLSASAEAELVQTVAQGSWWISEKQRVFPSPRCSEQSQVFVFPGRAPSCIGRCSCVPRRRTGACCNILRCLFFLMSLCLCLFRPIAPPGIVWTNNGCLSFCISVFVLIMLMFVIIVHHLWDWIVQELLTWNKCSWMFFLQSAHQLMFLFFGFSWTTSSVLRPHACGSPVTQSWVT